MNSKKMSLEHKADHKNAWKKSHKWGRVVREEEVTGKLIEYNILTNWEIYFIYKIISSVYTITHPG